MDRGFTHDGPTGIERRADQTIEAAMAARCGGHVEALAGWFIVRPHNPCRPRTLEDQFVGQGDQAPWLAEREFVETSNRPTGQK